MQATLSTNFEGKTFIDVFIDEMRQVALQHPKWFAARLVTYVKDLHGVNFEQAVRTEIIRRYNSRH